VSSSTASGTHALPRSQPLVIPSEVEESLLFGKNAFNDVPETF
jgi:hypothetical protein